MLRSDFDVLLTWITEEDYNNDKPALALDWEQGVYQISLIDITGNRSAVQTTPSAKAALLAFAAQIPD